VRSKQSPTPPQTSSLVADGLRPSGCAKPEEDRHPDHRLGPPHASGAAAIGLLRFFAAFECREFALISPRPAATGEAPFHPTSAHRLPFTSAPVVGDPDCAQPCCRPKPAALLRRSTSIASTQRYQLPATQQQHQPHRSPTSPPPSPLSLHHSLPPRSSSTTIHLLSASLRALSISAVHSSSTGHGLSPMTRHHPLHFIQEIRAIRGSSPAFHQSPPTRHNSSALPPSTDHPAFLLCVLSATSAPLRFVPPSAVGCFTTSSLFLGALGVLAVLPSPVRGCSPITRHTAFPERSSRDSDDHPSAKRQAAWTGGQN
jgi:hypothetical protein